MISVLYTINIKFIYIARYITLKSTSGRRLLWGFFLGGGEETKVSINKFTGDRGTLASKPHSLND